MSESVPVRCPACRREHLYASPSYPCACGAPVAPPLDPRGAPRALAHQVWEEQWVTVRCAACGRRGQWPAPELGCPCGTVLRLPVAAAPAAGVARPAFRPAPIRSAVDAVTAAARYLNGLGYRDIRRGERRPPAGIALSGHGLVAQVDPTARPARSRDVECLWLTAMAESSSCAYFSLAGYAEDARGRADVLLVPLFVLDLLGTPRPVNGPADRLDASGAP
ncbi:hypothetical protein [Streptomyces adustus]|uniref:hypothetical protein n=1 Tax=Streptomyces adustus TaxID=1609272 RepID=UPI003717A78A